MKGDFSDVRRWPAKHYTSVRMQQGRVQLDSDWNEAVEIADHRERTADTDIIGRAGAPKGDPGFQIVANAAGTDLTISGGHFYVDGILCELAGATTYATQPDLPRPDFIGSDGKLALPNGTYIAYLDAWERHVTALDDEELREPALGGADTTTRTKLIQQVKLLAVTPPGGAATCETAFAEWTALVTPNTGRLAARIDQAGSAATRCSVEAQAGYTGLENQLYRVEVHTGGKGAAARFKWSRENGAIAAVVSKQSGDQLTITPVPGMVLAKGDWVEVIDDGRELRGEAGTLARLKDVQGATLTLDPATLDPAVAVNLAANFGRTKVRRWEVSSPSATQAHAAVAEAPAWVTLENRVQVSFEAGGNWRSGVWWVVPARVAIGDVRWPRDASGNPALVNALGIEHHYARLALVTKTATGLTVTSCARKFPPLTAIAASDVSYDDTNCKSGATTVQEALDHLCARDRSCCEINVSPSENWAEQLRRDLIDHTDVSICFRPGTYTLDAPFVITGRGTVKIIGAGPATKIVASKHETALAIQACASVRIRDLSIEGGAVEGREDASGVGLNGALDVRGCNEVVIEDVVGRSASAADRHAATIAVRGAEGGNCDVRVRGCRLSIGLHQVGLLIVDATRAAIDDNVIAVDPTARPRFKHWLNHPRFRAAVRASLYSGFTFVESMPTVVRAHVEGEVGARLAKRKGAGYRVLARRRAMNDEAFGRTVTVSVGGREVRFRSDVARQVWEEALRAMPLDGDHVENEIRAHFAKIANSLIVSHGRTVAGHTVNGFRAWFAQVLERARVAAQGVVVAGTRADEVRIRANTISGVRQAVHVGVSHANPQRDGNPDSAGRVMITDNRIGMIVAAGSRGARHGVFVGNVDSLVVENNQIVGQHDDLAENRVLEGIRVYGFIGRMAVVRQNHISGCTTGILFNALNDKQDGARSMWRVNDNMAQGASRDVDPGVTSHLSHSGNSA